MMFSCDVICFVYEYEFNPVCAVGISMWPVDAMTMTMHTNTFSFLVKGIAAAG